MTKEEAFDVLQTIAAFYPNFQLTTDRAKALIQPLVRMNYDGVMDKLTNYALDHSFPPTLADIAVRLPEENKHLGLQKKWQLEAAQVPEETKQHFKREMERLLKKVSSND
ncbi:hypothetical protein [Aquibacillus rhizosphaerae]|uniref:Replicative helicase inhibitor G39P N-terminal domain-containing protein n=1 Tax=Aquibacillus rhizosphaerae TaxID=3051431 RepID=A0ABT7L9G4_9BACI|nr:hypothetical protein [Aquibacillus sp. LR5S19]MDL4842503.1 hypothetical protein [Aquibacillus sp. LR5S19]